MEMLVAAAILADVSGLSLRVQPWREPFLLNYHCTVYYSIVLYCLYYTCIGNFAWYIQTLYVCRVGIRRRV